MDQLDALVHIDDSETAVPLMHVLIADNSDQIPDGQSVRSTRKKRKQGGLTQTATMNEIVCIFKGEKDNAKGTKTRAKKGRFTQIIKEIITKVNLPDTM